LFPPGSRLRAEVVEVTPLIVHHPSDVVVKVGSPATLSCRAEGTPEPSIEWLRNGQPLEMDKLDSQPIVLSEGSLFFLNVVPGRRSQSHEGVYACVAKNSAGKATSRNASLYIAGKTVGNSFKLDGHAFILSYNSFRKYSHPLTFSTFCCDTA
jgi:hypothetical protein